MRLRPRKKSDPSLLLSLIFFFLCSCGAAEALETCKGSACADSGTPCAPAPAAQIYINELLAKNDSGLTDESGKAEDWIELYNGTDQPVDLAGFYLSDDPGDPTRARISAESPDLTTIQPGGFLVLWADKDREEGSLHRGIKLSAGGESVLLFHSDGETLIDSIEFGAQAADVSYGRSPDGCDAWITFTTPTPGSPNP